MALTVIVAPPPTPNGDLHVGHLSGPYLGADVCRRYLALRGESVVSALSADLNQSYVVTTAQRLGIDPTALAQSSYEEVNRTLEQAQIRFDRFGMPDPVYAEEIKTWFRALHASGALAKHRRTYPFDIKQNRFMFESFASGRCAVCLSPTNANICEACGHPNESRELLFLHPTNGKASDPIEEREVVEFSLELEPLRDKISGHLNHQIPEQRPALRRLLSELFAKELPSFPVTFPSNWGIPAPFPDAEGLCLNVWAEMVPGHYHWIESAARKRGVGPVIGATSGTRYIQYLGFDNSFFYVVAQLALALVARDAGMTALLPSAFVTNEFYLLENFKFSTSQGHLIWGRELLSEVPADEARFYLAWSNPEYNQTNFTRSDMAAVLERKLRVPLQKTLAVLERLSAQPVQTSLCSRAITERFEAAYQLDHPSLRIAALTVANGLDILAAGATPHVSAGELRAIARAVAAGLAPLSPGLALSLWQAAGAEGPVTWPGDAMAMANALT